MTTTVLHRDAWVTVTVDGKLGLVRYQRNGVPFATDEDIKRSYGALVEIFERVPPGLLLLIDIREAPPRNDASFEDRANAAIVAVTKKFKKHPTLVRTAVGKLLSIRLATARKATPHVFDDEQAALSYLRS